MRAHAQSKIDGKSKSPPRADERSLTEEQAAQLPESEPDGLGVHGDSLEIMEGAMSELHRPVLTIASASALALVAIALLVLVRRVVRQGVVVHAD